MNDLKLKTIMNKVVKTNFRISNIYVCGGLEGVECSFCFSFFLFVFTLFYSMFAFSFSCITFKVES